MPNYNAFRDWLTEELAKRNWNYYELGKRSKVSPSYLAQILEGERQPGITTIEKIANGLHLPPEVVFLRVLGQSSDTDEGLDQLQMYFTGLPADDRARLLMIARALWEAHAK